MPVKFWQSVYRSTGWPVRYLGEPLTLPDGMEVWAGEFAISADTLDTMRQTTGIAQPVLTTPIEQLYKSASLRQRAFNQAALATPQAGPPIAADPASPAIEPAPTL